MAKQPKFSGKSAFTGKKSGSKPKKSGGRASSGKRGGDAWRRYTSGSRNEVPF